MKTLKIYNVVTDTYRTVEVTDFSTKTIDAVEIDDSCEIYEY